MYFPPKNMLSTETLASHTDSANNIFTNNFASFLVFFQVREPLMKAFASQAPNYATIIGLTIEGPA